ncbi:DUF1156 domain-containing protein [Microbacterium maritypicum]|uniref:DUF1156 domain-containing protein n=1 Tax=Microbacterium maritypicum TaxID=33918 RepID=A0ACD4B3L0_MICMQ|nr:DUF1156 domain-containing protein [Microbacterium liquefaciens]UTT52008.1 DUF1156 domain-containing protein [Microbacterium liquefaciens]
MTQPTKDASTTPERRDMTAPHKKKLIETSLPLEAINAASQHEKSVPRKGHPATMHLYWARRPLVAARAVLFAQLVDDPASRPEEFPTAEAQDAERARLHELMEKLVVWENSNDECLMEQARNEIRKSNNGQLPAIVDPFAGGGAIPVEAQRLGLEAHASDLNPLAVLINKALIEIAPTFSGNSPIFPGAAKTRTGWVRAEGLGEDVRRYGEWMRDEAKKRIGHLYPKVKADGGTEHTVIAWVWARTVKSPNPANPIEVPLVRSWWLCKKKGKEAWVHAEVVDGQVQYEVRHDANGPKSDADGTIKHGKGAWSVIDGTPFTYDYIREAGKRGEIGAHLIAVVAEGKRGRVYVSPTPAHVEAANVERVDPGIEAEIPNNPRWFSPPAYGLTKFSDLFTNRQLRTLTVLSDLISAVRAKTLQDALDAGMSRGARLEDGGAGAEAYADAIATYLSFAISKLADWSSSICSWIPQIEGVRDTFARQAIPMVWDYVEINPFSNSVGHFFTHVDWVASGIDGLPSNLQVGQARQLNAAVRDYSGMVVSTDPPYYDNIGYSDLSDYFYVWLRRSLGSVQSKTLGTVLTPKSEELVANPYRHNGKAGAAKFFVDGFNDVFRRIRESANHAVPLTLYYAYKQQDTRDTGTTSTGWHTLLDGLIDTGWEITATWPMRSERGGRMISVGTNALASSIVLACRPRPVDAPTTTRRAFVATLKSELPAALHTLMQGTVAPVDLAQAAIGPGIAVFSRYSRVREADGSDMSVKDALVLVNATLDEVIGDQESDFDGDTRFAIKWYRQYGWAQENSGIADQLARSSDTSIGALERGGIFEAKGGKARLLAPSALGGIWDVASDDRVSVWEATVRLAAVMAKDGVDKVAVLIPAVQSRVNLDAVKELGFLLFHEAEKKKDSKDAGLFNGLVSAWGELNEQARKFEATAPQRDAQLTFDFDDAED